MADEQYVVQKHVVGRDGQDDVVYWSNRVGWTEFDEAQLYPRESLGSGLPGGGSWRRVKDPLPQRPDGPYAGWIFYDHNFRETLGQPYRTYREALEDLDARLNNVIVVRILLEEPPWGPPCECEWPGEFNPGMPGMSARLENGRLTKEVQVKRCDLCELYKTDAAARQALAEALERKKT